MADALDRVSITVPADLLGELDEVVEEWEYDSRSEATRDALRAFLTEYRRRTTLDGVQRGSVVVLYDHDVSGVTDAVLELQHDLADTIVAVQHVHLSEQLCMETLVVDGPGEEVRELVERLGSLRGVKQVDLAVVAADD